MVVPRTAGIAAVGHSSSELWIDSANTTNVTFFPVEILVNSTPRGLVSFDARLVSLDDQTVGLEANSTMSTSFNLSMPMR